MRDHHSHGTLFIAILSNHSDRIRWLGSSGELSYGCIHLQLLNHTIVTGRQILAIVSMKPFNFGVLIN